jgi:DHA3 family tetracycline resistance protein-like MFS transporter
LSHHRYHLPAPVVYLVMTGGMALLWRAAFTMSLLYQVTTAGLSPLQLVLVGTGMEIAILLFEIPTGVVADTLSRRLSILVGVAIMGVAFILYGSIPTFPGVLAGSCLWGLGYTFTSGADSAWVYDEVGEARAQELFLRAAQLDQVVSIVAVLASAGLGLIAVNLPIVAGGVGLLLLALFLALVMSEAGFTPTPPEERDTWRAMGRTLRAGVGLVRGDRLLVLIFALALVIGLYSEGYDRLWTPLLVEVVGLPRLPLPVWFGLIELVGRLLALGATEVARRGALSAPGQAARSLLWIVSAMVVSLLLVATGPTLGVVLAATWTFDTFRALYIPIHEAWINQSITDSSVRATVISMIGQLDAFGQIAGGPGVGLIGERVAIRAALLVSTALLIPAVPLHALALRQGRSPEKN